MVSDISNIFLATTIVLSTIFGVVLIFKNNAKTPTLLLGLFLIFYGSEAIIPLLENFFSQSAANQMLYFPISMGKFIFVPLLYLYAKNLVSPISIKKEWIHLLPGAIEFLFFTIIFFFPVETKKWMWESEETELYDLLYLLISFIYSVYYVFKTIRFINNYKRQIENFYSTLEGKLLTWIKNIAIFLLFVAGVWIVSNFIVPIFYVINIDDDIDSLADYLGLIIDTVNLFFIGYVAVMGLRQSALLDFAQMQFETAQKVGTTSVEAKDVGHQFYKRLMEYMTANEPFTDPNLTLVALAKDLNMPARKLSETIKQQTSYNFNQFINSHRVEKAKVLLTAPQYAHYTILGIAGEAGFNSKATFNNSFKHFVQMTPSQFKKQAFMQKEAIS